LERRYSAAFLDREKLGVPNSVCGEEAKMTIIPLRKMLSGQKGVISKVKANGELGRRIRDMGVVPGTPIQIQGRAPLKDPVAIRVRDFTLTLRNNEADHILVDVNEAS
jgi:ferrous iron transport protein A